MLRELGLNQAGRWDQLITTKQNIQHIPSCQILHDQPSQATKQAVRKKQIQLEETDKVSVVIQGVEN